MLGCGLPLVLMVSFCAGIFREPARPRSEKTVRSDAMFQGFKLPGTAMDAKKSGFTSCTADYYAATCTNAKAVLMGISAPAVIRMELNEGHMPDDLRQLSYRQIEFQLPLIERKDRCTADPLVEPLACDVPNPTRTLQETLLSKGWKMREWQGTRTYYHPAQTVAIEVTQFSPGATAGVSIEAVDQDEVKSVLSQISKTQADHEEKSGARESFTKKMNGDR